MKKLKLMAVFGILLMAFAVMADAARAKYVFLFIGDGMGENIRKFYLQEYPDSCMENFPVIVRTGTNNVNNGRTDSAASGTAIACGIKTYNGAVGVNKDGKPVTSLAKIMRDNGYSIGIITTVGLNDATPGAHFGHRTGRKDYAGMLADLYASNFDFFAGGFLLMPKDYSEKQYSHLLKQVKYDFRKGFEFNEKTPKKRVVFIGSMEGAWPGDKVQRNKLKEVVEFATNSLSANKKGFFMVVEGGAIDHRAHGNDLAGTMRETREFDIAIKYALEFQKKHPNETLIIVTSDHDTGGLNIDVPNKKADLWQKQPSRAGLVEHEFGKKLKTDTDEQLIRFLADHFSMGELTAEEMKIMQEAMKIQRDPNMRKKKNYRSMYRSYNPTVIQMMRLRDARHGVSWTGFDHTPRKVLTSAQGVGQDYFKSVKENSDIPHAISMAVFGKDVMTQAAETLPQLVEKRMEEYFNFISVNTNKAVFRYGQKKAAELVFEFKGKDYSQTVKRNDRFGRVTFEKLTPDTEYTMIVKRSGKVIAERQVKTVAAAKGKLLARIGVLADPHTSLFPDARHGRMHSKSVELLEKSCKAFTEQKVDFVAMPGDVTDASLVPELAAVSKVLAKNKQLKFYGVPGNHDRLHRKGLNELWIKTFGAPARLEKHGKLQILLLDTGNGMLSDKEANVKAIEALDPALPVVVISHYQLTPDAYLTDGDRAIHDADKEKDGKYKNPKLAAAVAPLLEKLAKMQGVLLIGHKNVATTAKLGNLLQINLPQLTHFPAGVAYVELYTDGMRIEFQPMLDEFYDEYGRIRGNAMGQKAMWRDRHSLKLWNAFYPLDLSAAE